MKYATVTTLKMVIGLSWALGWGGLTGCSVHNPASPAAATRAPKSFRVMSYNIHHGEGMDGKVDLQRIADLIQAEGADLVALQEVDKGTQRTDRRDLGAELAALTGMTCVFSNNFHYQGGEYGNAVLSRFPVKRWTNRHFQMLKPAEPRGLLQVVVDLPGGEMVFMSTHLDFSGDGVNRWSSVGEIEAVLPQYAGLPVILCGDFNDVPTSRVYRRLSETFDDTWVRAGAGDGFTIAANRPNKRIDYIWVSRNAPFTPVKAWVPSSLASDHLPVVAEFQFH
jgi:endonuclease/exonuclease/phosphatase family metal-dependent hydrolase